MRRHERWPRDERRVARQEAGHRVDRGDLQRLVRVSGGSRPGSRCASMVLPTPGGPVSMRWCAPAAATSTAKRAGPDRRRREVGRVLGVPIVAAAIVAVEIPLAVQPRLQLARGSARPTPRCRRRGRPRPGCSMGTTTRANPACLAASTAGSTPLTGRTRPSSASSPSSTVFSSRGHVFFRSADSTASASATS